MLLPDSLRSCGLQASPLVLDFDIRLFRDLGEFIAFRLHELGELRDLHRLRHDALDHQFVRRCGILQSGIDRCVVVRLV